MAEITRRHLSQKKLFFNFAVHVTPPKSPSWEQVLYAVMIASLVVAVAAFVVRFSALPLRSLRLCGESVTAVIHR